MEKHIFNDKNFDDAWQQAIKFFKATKGYQIEWKIIEEDKNHCIIEAWPTSEERIKRIEEPDPEVDAMLAEINRKWDKLPKCPTCGSKNLSKVSTVDKAASAFFFGLFSQKIKKQFHCNNCGYEW